MPDIYVASEEKNKENKNETVQKEDNQVVSKEKEDKKNKKENQKNDHTKTSIKREAKEIKKKVKQVIEEVGEKKTHEGLTAFAVWPDKVRFETQESKEEIILLLRRHIITNVAWILTAVFMFFVPFFLRFIPVLDFLPFRFQFIIVLMWYLIILAFIFEKFLSWYFNVFIVTDERIIDVDFLSLVYKEITESKIDRIQDVTLTMGGICCSIFNYGTVYIQTAGDVPKIEFEQVPKPQKVVKILNQLQIQEEQEQIEGRVR